MSSFETILYDVEGPMGIITLNRPDKLNAINGVMVKELNLALDQAEHDDTVRVIILRGAGRAFSSGFDLDYGDVDTSAPDFWREELTKDFNIIVRFWDSPKPTIAAVHKYCLGSAMEMAVACDITVSADDCRFGAPEVQFGAGIVALILPWLVGPKKSKELLLTGTDKISAEEAKDIELINKVVPFDSLEKDTAAIALQIAANDQLAVKLTKQAINRSLDAMGFREAMQQALELDIEIETTDTPESEAFNQILEAEGPKAAIAWRRAQVDKT